MITVQGNDGKSYKLDISPTTYSLKTEAGSRSKFQYQCQLLLKEKFPLFPILSEIPLPGTGGLVLDFLIVPLKIAFECQGRQHGEYVPFFHKSPKGFKESQKRDSRKREWCEINGFEFYTVDTVEELRKILGLGDGTESKTNKDTK